MAMEPFVPFPEEYTHSGEDNLLWAMSTDFHFDCAPAFPDLMPEFEPPLSAVEVPPPAVQRSAFRRYARADGAHLMECSSSGAAGSGRNMQLRVIEMLRRIPRADQERGSGVEMSRGFRHMMRERQRREKLSQSYADLYDMLASRSKSDKNSIVQSAAEYVRELKGAKEALQKRNEELKARILGVNDGAKIKIRVANPSSPIDSMIGALRCLQSMDVKAKAIRSDLSGSEFSAIMSIDTKIATADVERAVEKALVEVEKKLRCQLPGIST
ncbi:hypothetical protein Cni_G01174 [Canna indica]|uniref:BHLH domain-containing protein n=1 Tax=Canna indica TaxID=4628 RepID=A0AAQ3PYA7_9LILI|nr:hypothetical protein Cni_G01174 [Canna indica]